MWYKVLGKKTMYLAQTFTKISATRRGTPFRNLLLILSDPLMLVLLGLMLVLLALILYPGHHRSIFSGILMGIGISVLLWVAYKVIGVKS